jgi:hypothetical protein
MLYHAGGYSVWVVESLGGGGPAGRLEQLHVEHIMERSPLWKLKGICHLLDTIYHLEGANTTWPELVLSSGLQQVRQSVEDTKPHLDRHQDTSSSLQLS